MQILTQKLARSILAREGIAAVWQLHVRQPTHTEPVTPVLRLLFWRSPKRPRKGG